MMKFNIYGCPWNWTTPGRAMGRYESLDGGGRRRRCVGALAAVAALGAAAALRGRRAPTIIKALALDGAAPLAFTVATRGYAPVSTATAALYGTWSHVVEPLRTATFTAVNAAEGASLTWRIASLAASERDAGTDSSAGSGAFARTWAAFDASHEWVEAGVSTTVGASADLVCGAVHARYRVTLSETSASSPSSAARQKTRVETVVDATPWMNADGEVPANDARGKRRRRVATSDAVVCKYVRRELRSLTEGDRDAYLGALAAVHRLEGSSGKAAYGRKFRSQKAFLAKHLGEDTVAGCTVFHGSDAFLTGHAAFTLELEQALQSIDASIAAPHWDTSLDDAAYGSNWAAETDVFGYFGGRSGDGAATLDYPALTEGRFAYVEIPTDASSPERNAFGRMTQSYNNDPAEFLWRTSSVCGLPSKLRVPGCDALRGVLAESAVSDFRAKLETDWHGVLHPTLGGAFDCGSESGGASYFAELDATAPELVQFVHQLAEVAWDVAHATGYAVCPASCGANATFGECRCACPKLDEAFADGESDAAYAWLDEIGMLSRYAGSQRGGAFVYANASTGRFSFRTAPGGAALAGADEASFFLSLAKLACSPGRVAPFMTPLAASNDPLFWVTHASFEKIWALRRLASPSDANRGRSVEAAAVAAAALASLAPGALPAFDETWDWKNATPNAATVGAYCVGKAWHDPSPFSSFLGEKDDGVRYTNSELYALFDPTNARLPYVFDDLSWAHCRTDDADVA